LQKQEDLLDFKLRILILKYCKGHGQLMENGAI